MIWFLSAQKKIQMNSEQTKTRHYKPREKVQSAHWPDVSGAEATQVNTGRKVLCSRLLEITEDLYSHLVASLYRFLHIYSTLPHSGYKANVAAGSFLA